ncbi:MAG: YggS family pyridoxal phosphate-dependent enzyme [Clostridia bacterium]|nr:YggS family pyridoxal phosphate-dependent enzyme [Clostridia bacterium]
MSGIKENIDLIRNKINIAAKKSGREGKDIVLLAATKTVTPDRINEAIDAGITDIGENRVQEFQEKYDFIKNGVNHHFIGHLQTNKVKYIVGKTCLIHSCESEKLIDEIERLSAKHGIVSHVLIEVNASGEDTKFGVNFEDVSKMLENNETRQHVFIDGLMTIGPNIPSDAAIRNSFINMKKLFDSLSQIKYKNSAMKYLSMGMSADYETAIEEGANIVRVGSAIFGKRDYSK